MPEYTLRQTTPEQVMTHWSTCYTHHSSCMERKVDQMTGQIQAMQVDGSAYAMGYQRADDAARAVIERLRAENVALKEQLGIAILALDHLADGSSVRNVVTLARDALLDIREVGP